MQPAISIHDRLSSVQSEVREAALSELLESCADPSPHLEALAACVRDPSEPLRIPALVLLGRIGAPAADFIARALDPQQPAPVRTVGAALIAGMGPTASGAVRELCRCLTADDESLRNAASIALGKIGEPAVPSLRIMLQFANPAAVAAAVGSLAMIGPPAASAVPEIEALAARSSFDIQLSCASALCRITGSPERGLSLLANALGNADSLIRKTAAENIALLGTVGHSAIPSVLHCTADPDASVRTAAVLALGRMRAPHSQVLPEMQLRLGDPDAEVRYAVAVVMASYGADARSALPALRSCLQDPVEKVAQCAAGAIARIESADS